MKTTELIKQLQTLVDKHGDKPVRFAVTSEEDSDDCLGVEIDSVSVKLGPTEERLLGVQEFLICDRETTLAFI